MRIYDLNLDIFHDLAGCLDVDDIVAVRSTNRFLQTVADDVVIPTHLSSAKRKVFYENQLHDYQRMLRCSRIDSNWDTGTFHSTQLLHTHSSIPVLITHQHLLILGSRSAIFVWDRRRSRYTRFVISNHNRASLDITGLVVVDYAGDKLTIIASHVAGLVQRVVLNLHTRQSKQTAIYNPPCMANTRSQHVRTLKGTADAVISAREIGQLNLITPSAPWMQPTVLNVDTSRLWGVDVNTRNGLVAISHNYNSATQSAVSLFNLSESKIDSVGVLNTPSFVSSFTAANGTSTNGCLASPEIIIGGFYDSSVRIYDRRCGYGEVSHYEDTLDPQPIYSVDVGGAYDSQICAGSALYSRLRVIDVRMPTQQAHHIYAANSTDRSSPVYQLQVDHSHCYVATDCKVHDVDFSTTSPNHQFATIRA